MNKSGKARSLFVFPAVAMSVGLLVAALVMATMSWRERAAWLGAAASALPLLIVLARAVIAPVARTSESLPLMLLVAFGGLTIAGWEFLYEGAATWRPLLAAGVATSLLLLYVFWYSRYGRHPDPRLDVGAKLPDFELIDMDGNAARTSELRGAPAVLLFYRGNWCPVCMAQVRELADRYEELARLGVTVWLVSPQPERRTRALAAKLGIPFRFMVDNDNRVASELGIAVNDGVPVGLPGAYPPDTVMPTLIVANAFGTIVFSDQTDNYRVRPEPDIFIAILRRAGAITA